MQRKRRKKKKRVKEAEAITKIRRHYREADTQIESGVELHRQMVRLKDLETKSRRQRCHSREKDSD